MARRRHTGEVPLLVVIMLACVVSVLGASVVMDFVDPHGHWALRAHILAGLAITAVLVVILGRCLLIPPFARQQ